MDGLERSRLVILWAGMGETALSFYQYDPGHGWQRNPFFINQIQEWYGSGTYWSYRLWKFQGIYGKNIHHFFTIKTLGKGTGLGLYAVKSLVTKYQGKVSVETGGVKGRTFKLEFPALSQT